MPLLPTDLETLTAAYAILSPVAISGMAACVRLIVDSAPLTARIIIRNVIVSVFVGVNAHMLASDYFKQRSVIVAITSGAALVADYVLNAFLSVVRSAYADPAGICARLLLKIFPSLKAVREIKEGD